MPIKLILLSAIALFLSSTVHGMTLGASVQIGGSPWGFGYNLQISPKQSLLLEFGYGHTPSKFIKLSGPNIDDTKLSVDAIYGGPLFLGWKPGPFLAYLGAQVGYVGVYIEEGKYLHEWRLEEHHIIQFYPNIDFRLPIKWGIHIDVGTGLMLGLDVRHPYGSIINPGGIGFMLKTGWAFVL